MSYSSTADWNSLYHALLNASPCLIQDSLSNSPFSLKSAYIEYIHILDPILPRSTHDCFAWIDNFNPVCYRISYSILAHFIWSIYPKSRLLSLLTFQLPASFMFLYSISTHVFFHTAAVLPFIYTGILHTVVAFLSIYAGNPPNCSIDIIYLCKYPSILQ